MIIEGNRMVIEFNRRVNIIESIEFNRISQEKNVKIRLEFDYIR